MSQPSAGEAALARRLTHTEKSERDAGFSLVASWAAGLGPSSPPADALKLWRALFYCMWMSDKTLVQQDLALRMARMLRALPPAAQPPFVAAFFATMRREWLGLDRYRVDKFLSLIRRVVCEALRAPPVAHASSSTNTRTTCSCTPSGGSHTAVRSTARSSRRVAALSAPRAPQHTVNASNTMRRTSDRNWSTR